MGKVKNLVGSVTELLCGDTLNGADIFVHVGDFVIEEGKVAGGEQFVEFALLRERELTDVLLLDIEELQRTQLLPFQLVQLFVYQF